MAITSTQNYLGDWLPEILEKLVLGAQTIEAGLLNMQSGHLDQLFIPRLQITDPSLVLQDRIPEPVNEYDMNQDDRILKLADFMAYTRFLPQEFENDFPSEQPIGALVDQAMSPEVLRAILSVTRKQINFLLDECIWQGDDALPATNHLHFFDGYNKLISTNGGQPSSTSGTGAITKANVLQEFENLILALPDAVYAQENLRIVCSWKVARLYAAASRDAQIGDYKGTNYPERIPYQFDTIPVIPVGGQQEDTLVAGVFGNGVGSNFYAGTWMDADRENFKVERWRPEAEYWFLKALFKFSVAVPWYGETAYRLPV